MQETLETNYFQTNGHLVFFVVFFYIINSCYNKNILDKRFQIYFFLASGVTSTVEDVILQVTYAVTNACTLYTGLSSPITAGIFTVHSTA